MKGGITSLEKKEADAVHKDMSTIIFFSTSAQDHVKSLETLNNACIADERCKHRVFFRPLMTNVYQFINGNLDDEGKPLLGCREILYLPSTRQDEIERLERTKNVTLKINSMCFVNKEEKIKKLIDWLLEETEEIEL